MLELLELKIELVGTALASAKLLATLSVRTFSTSIKPIST
jgi:hypothetical protein